MPRQQCQVCRMQVRTADEELYGGGTGQGVGYQCPTCRKVYCAKCFNALHAPDESRADRQCECGNLFFRYLK